MRVVVLIRRAGRALRAFWAANLQVAGEWRQDRRRLLRYVLLTWVVDALALAAVAWFSTPVRFHDPGSLIATVVLISLANALVRPIVVRFLIRYAVLTFGLLSLLINGLMIGLVAQLLPGFEVGSFPVAFALSLYLAIVNMVLGTLLDLDWADSYYRQVVLELVRREAGRRPGAAADAHGATDATRPGLLIIQVDGLSEPLLRFALRTGNAPHLARWVRSGSHRIAPWTVLLPSQTSASQAGILHGNNDGIPAFRWFEKATGRLLVSNRPSDAAEIERRVSSGTGLLAFGGSSVTNLLSGDATRSVLTNSTLRARNGVRSGDFFGFFVDPAMVFRTLVLSIGELARELLEARRQRLREVEPRTSRAWPFPLLRIAACVVLRDLSVGLVLEDMYRGAPVIYVDLVGYDEIAHHAGPERPEALDAVAEVDRQIGILARAAAAAPRRYRLVVLSDHGQSQGATFRQRFGMTLDDLVRELLTGEPEVLAATSDVEGWGYVNTVLTQMATGEGRSAKLARRRLRSRTDGGPESLADEPERRAEPADEVQAGPPGEPAGREVTRERRRRGGVRQPRQRVLPGAAGSRDMGSPGADPPGPGGGAGVAPGHRPRAGALGALRGGRDGQRRRCAGWPMATSTARTRSGRTGRWPRCRCATWTRRDGVGDLAVISRRGRGDRRGGRVRGAGRVPRRAGRSADPGIRALSIRVRGPGRAARRGAGAAPAPRRLAGRAWPSLRLTIRAPRPKPAPGARGPLRLTYDGLPSPSRSRSPTTVPADTADLATPYRTHTCGALRAGDAGHVARLAGWVHRRRDYGKLMFIDLRDRHGITQVVVDAADAPEAHEVANRVRSEFVIAVEGEVAPRQPGTENARLATGAVELQARRVTILNEAKTPPFYINDPDAPIDESLRLRYRYLDIRREAMQQRLLLRSRLVQAIREVHHANGFVEVETPNLIKSTPEGARDFIVPSRLQPGTVYALPQSPQQLKQLLMVAGIDRYFQIARCFRDEDLRGDRQPEFTQLDLEMSFVDEATVMGFIERMVIEVSRATVPARPIREIPFPVFTFDEAMERFGSDKPDLRFAMELFDAAPAMTGDDGSPASGFRVFDETLAASGRVKGITVQGEGGVSRREIDELTELARRFGARGLVHLSVQADGELHGPIAKFLGEATQAALRERAGATDGDLVLLVADRGEVVNDVLGRLRVELGSRLGPRGPRRARVLLGPPLPDVPVGRGASALGRDAQPVQRRAPGGRGAADHAVGRPRPAVARGPCGPRPGDAVRRGAQRLGAGGWLGPDLAARPAGAELQPPGLHAGPDAGTIRRDARGVRVRSAAARRDRPGDRPLGGAARLPDEHPRGDGVPQDAVGLRSHARGPVGPRRRPVRGARPAVRGRSREALIAGGRAPRRVEP